MENVILLHGALGSANQLTGLHNLLAKKYNVHNLDLPGHGGTESNGNFSIEGFSRFVQTYMNNNGIARTHLFGYSMGGYVATYLAATSQHIISSVTTLGTKFLWNEEIATAETAMLDPDKITQKVPAFAEELSQRHYPVDWKMVAKNTSVLLTRMGIHNPLQMVHFHGLECPCLFLLGDRDKMVSLAETVTVFKQVKQAQLGIMPGTEHRIEKTDQHLLAVLLGRFIDTAGKT